VSLTATILLGLIAVLTVAGIIAGCLFVRRVNAEHKASLRAGMVDCGFDPGFADFLTLMDGWHYFNVAMLTGATGTAAAVCVIIYDALGYFG